MDPSQAQAERVALRAFPYPFRAMLAINSDIDRMSPWRFRELHRFLNTNEETPLGPGLGLDIADSLWFYRRRLGRLDPISVELSYFHGHDSSIVSPYAEELLHYIRCGWIDTIHGYGNFSGVTDPALRFTRRHAEDALAVLARAGLTIPVWSNHGARGNSQNIGRAPWMEGDDPESAAYHADLLREAGVIYHWGSGDSTTIGHPTKLIPRVLQDGQKCWEFTRFSSRPFEESQRDGLPPWQVESERARGRAAAMVWLPRWLHIQLAEPVLRDLIENEHFAILAQHLGTARPMIVLGGPAADSLTRLASLQGSGEILIARTARLLAYNRARDHLRYALIEEADNLIIDVSEIDDPVLGSSIPSVDDLRGITFRLAEERRARLFVAGREVDEAEILRGVEDDGVETIGFAWFAPDHTDYSKPFVKGLHVLTTPEEHAQLSQAGVAINRALESGSTLGEPLSAAQAAATRSALRAHGRPLSELVTRLRAIGFVEFEAIHLGCGAGDWCVALAKAGATDVLGLDPRPSFVELARAAAEAAGVESQTRFALGNANQVQLESDCCEFVLWYSTPGFSNVEMVMAVAARALRLNSAMYATYPTEYGQLRSIERSLALGGDAWISSVRKLRAEALYRRGLAVAGGREAPDLNDLLAIADSRGLALVDQPRLAEGGGDTLGRPATVEVLLRREHPPSRLRDELLAAEYDEALLVRLEALLEHGAPRLVADVLSARMRDIRTDPAGRRLCVRALLLAGAAGDPNVSTLARVFDEPLVLGLIDQARGSFEEALERYAELDPGPFFLIGSAEADRGEMEAAENAFLAGLGDPGEATDCSLGLLDLAARRRNRESAEEWYGHHKDALADHATTAGASGAHE